MVAACIHRQHDHRRARAQHVAGRGQHAQDFARARRFQRVLHLHGFDDGQRLPAPHAVAGAHLHSRQRAVHGRAEQLGVVRQIVRQRGCERLRAAGRAHRMQRRMAWLAILGLRRERRQRGIQVLGVDRVAPYVVAQQQVLQQPAVGVDALDAELAQRAIGLGQRALVVAAGLVHDQLGQQRIEARVDGHAGMARAVDAHAGAAGRLVGVDAAAGGAQLALRVEVLRVDAQLHRDAARRWCLRQPEVIEILAAGDGQLHLDQVHAGHHFRDGVLHLQARVGLHEPELAIGAQQGIQRCQCRDRRWRVPA